MARWGRVYWDSGTTHLWEETQNSGFHLVCNVNKVSPGNIITWTDQGRKCKRCEAKERKDTAS